MVENDGLAPGAGSIRLAEETALVSKQRTATGRIDVKTLTDRFEEEVHAELLREGAVVTRVPFDIEVIEIPRVRTEGDVTIVPVLEEILVVEKRLILKEEIHITRTSKSDAFSSNVTLRRQRAVVERRDAAGKILPATEQDE